MFFKCCVSLLTLVSASSSLAKDVDTAAKATVSQRVMDNANTVHLLAGPAWLTRFDLLQSPGLTVQATRYHSRTSAWDIVSLTGFFTYTPGPTQRVREATGYVPSSRRPRVHLATGMRYAWGYGKLLIENNRTVLHFIPEVAAHAGVLWTDEGVHPAVDASAALRVRLWEGVEVAASLRALVSFEEGLVLGVMPSLLGGASF